MKYTEGQIHYLNVLKSTIKSYTVYYTDMLSDAPNDGKRQPDPPALLQPLSVNKSPYIIPIRKAIHPMIENINQLHHRSFNSSQSINHRILSIIDHCNYTFSDTPHDRKHQPAPIPLLQLLPINKSPYIMHY